MLSKGLSKCSCSIIWDKSIKFKVFFFLYPLVPCGLIFDFFSHNYIFRVLLLSYLLIFAQHNWIHSRPLGFIYLISLNPLEPIKNEFEFKCPFNKQHASSNFKVFITVFLSLGWYSSGIDFILIFRKMCC